MDPQVTSSLFLRQKALTSLILVRGVSGEALTLLILVRGASCEALPPLILERGASCEALASLILVRDASCPQSGIHGGPLTGVVARK